ncbi:flagellar biosynthetic protein FliO [Sedimenticola sp.]|uniref:flagellar biosynthetic protein FliO n=1 Tax=Sedimenticola sp. TaxID=1940285 RepID=UPI003D0D84D3
MKLPVILSVMPAALMPLITWAEAGNSVSSTLAPSPLAGGVLLETAGGLLLILVLIFALGWLLRRFGRLPLASKGEIAVLSGVSLGPRERAVLLRVGDTRLLVGVAPGRVQTLHVLEKESSGGKQTDLFSAQLESEITEQEK